LLGQVRQLNINKEIKKKGKNMICQKCGSVASELVSGAWCRRCHIWVPDPIIEEKPIWDLFNAQKCRRCGWEPTECLGCGLTMEGIREHLFVNVSPELRRMRGDPPDCRYVWKENLYHKASCPECGWELRKCPKCGWEPGQIKKNKKKKGR